MKGKEPKTYHDWQKGWEKVQLYSCSISVLNWGGVISTIPWAL